MHNRLRQGDTVVGYSRINGDGTQHYSVAGHSWSGTPIPHDAQDPDTGLRDRTNRRIHWGDVLRIKSSRLGGARLHAIVLDNARLFILERGSIEPLRDTGDPTQARFNPADIRIAGQAWDNPTWAEAWEQAQHLAPPERTLTWGRRASLATTQIAGLVAAIALQVALIGDVGPLLSTLGVILGTGLWYTRLTHRTQWLTRPRLLQLGVSSFALLAMAGAIAYYGLIALRPDLMGNVAQNAAFASAVMGVLLGAVGGMTSVCVGDLFAWTDGGYVGELPQTATNNKGAYARVMGRGRSRASGRPHAYDELEADNDREDDLYDEFEDLRAFDEALAETVEVGAEVTVAAQAKK